MIQSILNKRANTYKSNIHAVNIKTVIERYAQTYQFMRMEK